RADTEPNNPEAWHTMATYYTDKVTKDTSLSKPKIQQYTLAALAVEDKALAINPSYAEAVIFKNILLRIEARYEPDLKKREALTKEADDLYNKGLALQKAQTTGPTAPTKKGGE